MKALYAWYKNAIMGAGLIGLVALLYFALRLFLWEALVSLAWYLTLIYLTIPQGLIWLAFLVGVVMLALYSLRRTRRITPRGQLAPPLYADRRVAQVTKWFQQPHSAYYQGRINFALTKIATGAFALRGRASEQEIKSELRLGKLDIPKEVETYLQNGLKRWPELADDEGGPLDMLLRRSLPDWAYLSAEARERSTGKRLENFERLLQFLEEELENEHGD